MTASAPSSVPPPRLLYRAGPSILFRVVVSILLLALTFTLLSGALLALLVPDRPHLPLAGLAVLMWILLGGALALVLRPSFRVSSQGIEVRGYLSTTRLSWPQIALIDVDHALMNRGATVVVLHDGRRVTSALTGSRFALYRGESVHDHGPDLLQPARPTRAAIDAHQRWLHGAG